MTRTLTVWDRGAALIGGKWIEAQSGTTFDSINPATGQIVGTVADMGLAEARLAIEAAAEAFDSWRLYTAAERASVILEWCRLIRSNEDELGALLTAEQGKPLAEAVGEVRYAASFLDWFAGEAHRVDGQIPPGTTRDTRTLVLRQPAGVAAILTPWNFPYAMITRKVGAALAAGCTVVIKPAQDTPLCALALAELAQLAGVPQGVINVVTCADPVAVGRELTTNPAVAVVSFTGSTPVGKLLLEQAASTVKRVALELGGNAPVIVFDDADLDEAVDATMASKFRNAGQTCVCANRIFVHEAIYSQFIERLTAATAALTVGPGSEPSSTIGPLINEAAVSKVERLVVESIGLGARVMTGGQRHSAGPMYFQPTVLVDVRPDMPISQTEIFGPVACVTAFTDEDAVIAAANDTSTGLAAYAFTHDLSRAWRLAERLEYGVVGINDAAISTPAAPFGGMKESGLGREGGQYGIEEYLETKHVRLGIRR